MTRFRLCLLAGLATLAAPTASFAQSYPRLVTGGDGTRYYQLGPRRYGNYTGGQPTVGGGGVGPTGRPIYRGVQGGNTTMTTQRQNPDARSSYSAADARADAQRSDQSRSAEIARVRQQQAQISAQRNAYLQTLRRR